MNDEIFSKLKELTSKLPYLPEIISGDRSNVTNYKTKSGECIGEGLMNVPECAVQKFCMNKGAILNDHKHDIFELCVVYKGKLEVLFLSTGERKELNPAEFFYTYPETPHRITALEDTRGVAISIPRSKGYPDATK